MPAVPRTIRFVLALGLLAIFAALWMLRRSEIASLAPEPGSKSGAPTTTAPALSLASELSAAEQQKIPSDPPQWREPERRPGVDASNIYKNAFVLFDALTDAEKKMIRNPKDEVDADAAAALFDKIRAILELLNEAAKANYCDWGQAPYTFDTPLPQIQKAQDLGKLALWAAAYQFPTEADAAISTLRDRAQLGHHLADTLIGVLVQTAFERSAHELLLQHAPSFDPEAMSSARELLRGSKVDADLERAFDAEQASVAEMGKRLAGANSETLAMLVGMNGNDSLERRATNDAMTKFIADPERVAAEIEFIRAIEQDTARALTLPEAEYQAWRRETAAKLTDDHLLARMIMPSFETVQTRLQQTRIERTMLGAGLAVMQGGPGMLAGFRDPSNGRELTYVPTPAGFELRSTYAVKGKPVTMSFAQPK